MKEKFTHVLCSSPCMFGLQFVALHRTLHIVMLSQLFQCFNHLGLCQCLNTTRHNVDIIVSKADSKLQQWRKQAESAMSQVCFCVCKLHQQHYTVIVAVCGGTDVRELTRGLATLPQRWIQEPLVVRDRDGRPPRGPSGSALLLCV